ncbi:MAG: cbb3-type cytochrome c oxidase N-terminal domain-containing protein [Sulfurospirillaceae bacterium]|nr:cbb3-type cytochrome c oxidase N-terminal domain-containing protein [Sulfurospirillaceae bacterium]
MNWLSDNVNLLALIGAAVIIILVVFVVGKYIKQMKHDKGSGELMSDNWDGIGEYKNPLPIGWSLSFIGTIIWAIWYFLVGYPLNSYSQIGEYNKEVAEHNARFENKWANPDKDTLMGMGKGIFLVQCAPCHGVLGDGMDAKAADLTYWGGEDAVVEAILKGVKGSHYPLEEMPAGLLDEASAKAVTAFMMKEINVKKSTKNPDLVETGRPLWATCSACHGEDGKGMGGMSADISLYGTPEFIANVLNLGKKGLIGDMPKFTDDRLTKVQKLAVGTYIQSLRQ